MTNQEIKSTEHWAYLVPFTSELVEEKLIPYRSNSKLNRKIDYIFRHAKHIYRDEFIDVSTSGSRQLINDMAIRAIGMTRYFIKYPQQFNHKMDNIHHQILVRMWRQLFKHKIMQNKDNDNYMAVKMKMLMIENGLIEELIRTVDEKDYIQHGDDMIKKRKGKGLREQTRGSMKEGSKNFEYLCSLE